jgi:short-subunit dehydrogenase
MAALKRMKARDAGTIVQVGSALAYCSIPLQAPYCAAKAALRGFTDSLRCELAHERSRVHITMVQLSAFNTPQFDWARTSLTRKAKPLGKIFQPELAARAVYWAATHRRRELWVGWPAVQAIVASRLAPTLLYRFLAATGIKGSRAMNRCRKIGWITCGRRCGATTARTAASMRRPSAGARTCG